MYSSYATFVEVSPHKVKTGPPLTRVEVVFLHAAVLYRLESQVVTLAHKCPLEGAVISTVKSLNCSLVGGSQGCCKLSLGADNEELISCCLKTLANTAVLHRVDIISVMRFKLHTAFAVLAHLQMGL